MWLSLQIYGFFCLVTSLCVVVRLALLLIKLKGEEDADIPLTFLLTSSIIVFVLAPAYFVLLFTRWQEYENRLIEIFTGE